jgi:hypothetical protein
MMIGDAECAILPMIGDCAENDETMGCESSVGRSRQAPLPPRGGEGGVSRSIAPRRRSRPAMQRGPWKGLGERGPCPRKGQQSRLTALAICFARIRRVCVQRWPLLPNPSHGPRYIAPRNPAFAPTRGEGRSPRSTPLHRTRDFDQHFHSHPRMTSVNASVGRE